MIRTYTELSQYDTLEDRFDYLALNGRVSEMTFGFDRWINQRFYRSAEWRDARNFVIARDLGFDLGVDGFPIKGSPTIHHMNPIAFQDLEDGNPAIIDPEYLICTSHRTHNAIHYGDRRQLPQQFVERSPGDTRLW